MWWPFNRRKTLEPTQPPRSRISIHVQKRHRNQDEHGLLLTIKNVDVSIHHLDGSASTCADGCMDIYVRGIEPSIDVVAWALGRGRHSQSRKLDPAGKKLCCAIIGYLAPTAEKPKARRNYGHLDLIATAEKGARKIVKDHLAAKKPLGFTEEEIRKPNPKRTPWRPGLELLYFMSTLPVDDHHKVGVVLENEEADPDTPF
jgi:hypothetical protein